MVALARSHSVNLIKGVIAQKTLILTQKMMAKQRKLNIRLIRDLAKRLMILNVREESEKLLNAQVLA